MKANFTVDTTIKSYGEIFVVTPALGINYKNSGNDKELVFGLAFLVFTLGLVITWK